jgi:hypothetical protein
MLSSAIKGAVLAILTWLSNVIERWQALEDKKEQGRTEVEAETSKKTAETEHEMSKVDADPSSADSVSDSLRSGKF